MVEEFQALERSHTWDLVELPPQKTVIRCKWVYKIKTQYDGSIERYKVQLVAKWYSLEYGIDYKETFAHVARFTSMRSLLAGATVRHWVLFQIDVKNIFLNGELSEEVSMKPPPGYSHPSNKVCKLCRALYGLNMHREHGLRSSALQSSNLVSMPVLMTLPFLSATPTNDVFFYYFMLMI